MEEVHRVVIEKYDIVLPFHASCFHFTLKRCHNKFAEAVPWKTPAAVISATSKPSEVRHPILLYLKIQFDYNILCWLQNRRFCNKQMALVKIRPLSFLLWKDEDGISTSPSVSEFVSDAFDSCKINKEDLRKEMEQLVLDKRGNPHTQEGKL